MPTEEEREILRLLLGAEEALLSAIEGSGSARYPFRFVLMSDVEGQAARLRRLIDGLLEVVPGARWEEGEGNGQVGKGRHGQARTDTGGDLTPLPPSLEGRGRVEVGG